jgi:hypothetical protein
VLVGWFDDSQADFKQRSQGRIQIGNLEHDKVIPLEVVTPIVEVKVTLERERAAQVKHLAAGLVDDQAVATVERLAK